MNRNNIMFLAMVVEHYADRFQENGALSLNHMIQERSGFSKEEAFALVADAIEIGMIEVVKEMGLKKLVLNQSMYKKWRSTFVFQLPKIKASVVSKTWRLKRSDRNLTQEERAIIKKNIRKGRLFSVRKNTEKLLFDDVLESETEDEIPWEKI